MSPQFRPCRDDSGPEALRRRWRVLCPECLHVHIADSSRARCPHCGFNPGAQFQPLYVVGALTALILTAVLVSLAFFTA